MLTTDNKNLTQLLFLRQYKKILKYSKEEIFNDLSKTEPKTDIVNVINISKYDKTIETTKTVGLIISFALLGLAEVQGIMFSIGNLPISKTPIGYIIITAVEITIVSLIIDEIKKLIGIAKYRNNAAEYIADNEPDLVDCIEDNRIKRKIMRGKQQ